MHCYKYYNVILCPNNAKLVGCGMGMGFVPTIDIGSQKLRCPYEKLEKV